MRMLNNLTQLLQKPGEDALQRLEVCAPVLIEQLQEVLVRVVLEVWLTKYPQSSAAERALFEGLRRGGLVSQA